MKFQPGVRTAWHSHPLGQTLEVTRGLCRVQRWGGAVAQILVGDVVDIPAGFKHLHGAAADSAMTRIATTEALGGKAAYWMRPAIRNALQPWRRRPALLPSRSSKARSCSATSRPKSAS